MHFSVLSSLTLPRDIPGAIKNMAVDDVANFATRKLYLKSLSDKKIFTPFHSFRGSIRVDGSGAMGMFCGNPGRRSSGALQ